MMDVDDGYILWTGIWKGTLLFTFAVLYIHMALFRSSGKFKRFLSNLQYRTLAYNMLS